jgi:hypothetical protein
MEMNTNGSVRLTRQQISDLGKTIGRNPDVEEVELTHGDDGRLLVRQVVKVERLKALKLSK